MVRGTGWSETVVEVAGGKLHLARAGSGRPVLVLHHDIGSPDQLAFYDELASRFDVLVPHHPALANRSGPSGCAACAMSRDLPMDALRSRGRAGLTDRARLWRVDRGRDGDDGATRVPSVGSGRAMGLKPPQGDIFDQAIVSYLDYARTGFHDQQAFTRIYGDVTTDQLVEWDLCREMCFRIAWKPYMYSQTLPYLLGGVRAPALVVWGDDDKIVPRSAGETLCGPAAAGAARNRACRRALRRDGSAG